VASALEFMAARFGPPALGHLTVSPIPGTFGQGFPGLIYLSTLSYLKTVPHSAGSLAEARELFFQQVLQTMRRRISGGQPVTTLSYRDNWMMEALANYSALLYLEKTNARAPSTRCWTYTAPSCCQGGKRPAGESAGPITMGTRLESSQDPSAWRSVTYGKGTWIIHMLRRYLGDQRFFAMLAEVLKRYDHRKCRLRIFDVWQRVSLRRIRRCRSGDVLRYLDLLDRHPTLR